MSETNGKVAWVFYDGDCALCIRGIERLRPILSAYRFGIAPLQAAWVQHRLDLKPLDPLTEMVLLTSDGQRFGGADAILKSAQYIWWARPFAALASLPGIRPLLRRIYQYVAARRHCISGACRLDLTTKTPRSKAASWTACLPLLVFPPLVIALCLASPGWLMMWATAASIWFGCKCLTVWEARNVWQHTTFPRVLSYMVAWPGMNARQFLDRRHPADAGQGRLWPALARILLGALLLWGLARCTVHFSLIATGWIGLFGMVLTLHFGTFDLLGWLWRRRGVAALPIMRAPTRAMSVGEFWGRRWNVAFHELAQNFIFRPISKRWGTNAAILFVFIVSGLVHELVISIPARGGYGLPALYFLLQGAAIFFERSAIGRRLGLAQGGRGWAFVFTVTALPAFWLFHPTFIKTVILPFMEAIGAL